MGSETGITWCHSTFNPWRGCTKVSDGCKHCYAETMSGRNPKVLGVWGPNGARAIAAESYWKQPSKWAAEAKAAGERRRVFCASLADVGEGRDTMPEASWDAVQGARIRLSRTIMETADWLDWLLLTKRPENMPELYSSEVLSRCWLGTSVEDQQRADERIPHLLRCPAAVRFLSAEPLLGKIDLRYLDSNPTRDCLSGWVAASDEYPEGANTNRIEWVIAGAESGPHRRPSDLAWHRSLRDQCAAAGVAFFEKQIEVDGQITDDVTAFPPDLQVQEFPAAQEQRA